MGLRQHNKQVESLDKADGCNRDSSSGCDLRRGWMVASALTGDVEHLCGTAYQACALCWRCHEHVLVGATIWHEGCVHMGTRRSTRQRTHRRNVQPFVTPIRIA